MIHLDNLTPEQVYMLDIMWSLESYEEFQSYLDSLEPSDRKMAESLAKLIILAEMDDLVGECVEANEVLSKFVLH
jgi:hypothetical protein